MLLREFAYTKTVLEQLQEIEKLGDSAWSKPMSLNEILNALGEGSAFSPRESDVLFRTCDAYEKSLQTYPQLMGKLKEFIVYKTADFRSPFGSSDTIFTSKGHYSGLRHAHLSRDISIVYQIHGNNPRIIDLYGMFSHRDLGTGTPANRKLEKTMSAHLRKQIFTPRKF